MPNIVRVHSVQDIMNHVIVQELDTFSVHVFKNGSLIKSIPGSTSKVKLSSLSLI